MAYILIVIYFLLLVWLYFFIMKRLKNLSYNHMQNIWIKSLGRGYEILRRKLIVIMFFMFLVSSFIILIFFENELFYKIWLYDNKEALDSTSF